MPSPLAPAGRTARPPADIRPAVTVLTGFWPAATMAVARTMLAADPSLLIVRHDLSGRRRRLRDPPARSPGTVRKPRTC